METPKRFYKGASVFEAPHPVALSPPTSRPRYIGPRQHANGDWLYRYLVGLAATCTKHLIPLALVPSPAATPPPPPLSVLGSPPAFMPSARLYSDDIRATAAARGTLQLCMYMLACSQTH